MYACALSCALGAIGAPSAGAETLGMSGAITDNYKASYGTDPEAFDLRTWLSFDSVAASSTTWAPQAPAAISFSSWDGLNVKGADGRAGFIKLRVASGSMTARVFRYDPKVRWGPFGNVSSAMTSTSAPVRVELTLTSGGSVLATGVVEYRYEPAFAGVPSSHIEYHGPGGRWFIGGAGIATDWEPRPADPASSVATDPAVFTTAPPVAAPRIKGLFMPVRTRSPFIPIRVVGRAGGTDKITHIRFAIGTPARFGRWVRVAPRYRVRVARRNVTWPIRVQMRDAAGRVSRVAGRRVRCVCD